MVTLQGKAGVGTWQRGAPTLPQLVGEGPAAIPALPGPRFLMGKVGLHSSWSGALEPPEEGRERKRRHPVTCGRVAPPLAPAPHQETCWTHTPRTPSCHRPGAGVPVSPEVMPGSPGRFPAAGARPGSSS